MDRRVARQRELDAGKLPDFLPETKAIRDDLSWRVAPAPKDLQDRRTEITGPVDRKMVINALNSGAKMFMSDFEDSNTPTWENQLEGQLNIRDAVRGRVVFVGSSSAILGDFAYTPLGRMPGLYLNAYAHAALVQGEDGSLDVEGSTELVTLEQYIELGNYEEEDFHTVAGLLMHRLERIPRQGDSIHESGWEIVVTEQKGNRTERVSIRPLPKLDDEQG